MLQVLDYKLSSVVTRYALPLPADQNLPPEEAYKLTTATLVLWQVLLRHQLCDDVFR